MLEDYSIIPIELPDVGGKSYLWVYEHRKVFVNFVLNEISEATGFFKTFQDYCFHKIKNGLTRRTDS